MKWILAYLLFPGFCFTAVAAATVHWLDRKVTARLQWRVGPPLLQPVYDIVKLLGKETMVPSGASQGVFLIAPLMGLASVTLVSTLIWSVMLFPDKGFFGDLIVVLYFFLVPSLAVILGGFASKNPIASLGASREMKLMLADELPFLMSVFVPVIHAHGGIRLGDLVRFQQIHGMAVESWSGLLAFITVLFAVQAKLTFVPFDMPEAETEIMGGPYVEYSGPPLAVFRLTRMMMHFTMPSFLVLLFLGGVHFQGWSILGSLCKFVLILLLITLLRNTNPRFRIDQALKFFWGPLTMLAAVAVLLSLLGL
jgi:NADH-quinone oxidoreductase subunit H